MSQNTVSWTVSLAFVAVMAVFVYVAAPLNAQRFYGIGAVVAVLALCMSAIWNVILARSLFERDESVPGRHWATRRSGVLRLAVRRTQTSAGGDMMVLWALSAASTGWWFLALLYFVLRWAADY